MADLLTSSGADRVLTLDLNSYQTQGFFDKPVDNLHELSFVGILMVIIVWLPPIIMRQRKSRNFLKSFRESFF